MQWYNYPRNVTDVSKGGWSLLGIAGTQAAGLKSQFGTMCKPLHAGHAAATGAQAASLAARGFTSRDDILETEQGFVDTQSTSASPENFDKAMAQPAYTQDILFKYHAACYLTHSAIEATAQLCEKNLFDPNQIKRVTVQVDKGHFKVCNIQEPKTGLEVEIGEPTKTAKVVRYPLTFRVPRGAAPANYLGALATGFAHVILETTDPQTKEIKTLVRFAVE